MDKEAKNIIIKTTENILSYLNLKESSDVSINDDESKSIVSIISDDKMGMLIGKNGQNINMIEHLVKVVAFKELSKQNKTITNFSLDINDYKKSRSDYIIKIAREVAHKVSQTKRSEAMAPMNSYERRIVHTELAVFKDIETESVGEEPRRRIVIKPTLEI